MPLPTTATTAKQSAKKAAATRKQAQLDEEAKYIPPERYRPKAVKLPSLPESEISAELLQHFHDLGYTRDEIKSVAGAWLITQAELAQFEAKLDEANQQERDRIDCETAKLAAQMETCILQRGNVQTPAIRTASAERLLEFRDYYEAELDELHPQLMTENGNQHREAWDRLNGYLWECKQQLGEGPVTLAAYTGQDLDAELDDALEDAGS